MIAEPPHKGAEANGMWIPTEP